MAKYTEQFAKEWITATNKLGGWVVIDCDAKTKFIDFAPTSEARDHYHIEITHGDPDDLESLANTVCTLLNVARVMP